jgi:chemotaxis protein methyltransferase CheR
VTEHRLSDDDYSALERVLRARGGLVFQALRRSALETSATKVMRRIGVSDAGAFVGLLAQDGPVFDDLMAEVTIGETYFFRESAQFAVLRETIIPDLRTRHSGGEKVRVWSAGCSTGEEPYSLAIAFAEASAESYVVGTDVSRERLGAARRGEYRRWSFRGVPEPVIDRYFKRSGESFTLVPEVRRAVDFRYLNLASDCYPNLSSGVWGMNLILCRNVLIYFDRETIARVAASMLASLAEGGWIVLGSTDPPLSDFVKCEVVKTPAGLVYRHAGAVGSSAPSLASHPQAPLPSHSDARERRKDRFPDEPVSATTPEHQKISVEKAILSPPSAAQDDSAKSARVSDDSPAQTVRALANAGRLADAGRACAAALDTHRDNAELQYLHAILLAEAGQSAESARAAKRALYLDRDMIVAHLALGTALIRGSDTAGAQRSFKNAERLLASMPSDAVVPYTDGEHAGRLLEMTRVQSRLADRTRAA